MSVGIPLKYIPKETIIIGLKKWGGKRIPIIKAFLHKGQALFWCVWCKRFHCHGPVEGPRVSHCYSPDSPLYDTEYYIKVVEKVVREHHIMMQEERERDVYGLIGKRVRVRSVRYGKVESILEGIVSNYEEGKLHIRMPDGSMFFIPFPKRKGERIEVWERGEWKVWKEIPAKKPLKIAKDTIILLPK